MTRAQYVEKLAADLIMQELEAKEQAMLEQEVTERYWQMKELMGYDRERERLHLENCTEHAIQPMNNAISLFDTDDEGTVLDMARRHRKQVEIGRNERGNPIYKWVEGQNEQELLRNAAMVLIEHGCLDAGNAQTQAQAKPVIFEPYARKWKQLYKDGKKKHTTTSEYGSVLTRHIYPWFGKMDMRDITIDRVQAFLNSKSDTHSAKTIHEMKLILGMVLDAAKEDGIIITNPARSRRIAITSTIAAKKRNALTAHQASDIIDHLNDLPQERDRLYLASLLFTGMRRGEVLGLQWGDIDFEKNVILVDRSVTFEGNAPIIGPPKTAAGVRCIPLLPQFRAHLNASKQPISPHTFIIGGEQTPPTQQTVKRMWERIKQTINVHGTTPHYYRHTFVTLAHRAGVAKKTLQDIGGYADQRTMENVYTHTQEKDIQTAALQMGQMFQMY